MKNLQAQISEIETMIMLNQPPLTLLKVQVQCRGLTDSDYLKVLENFINGRRSLITCCDSIKS